MNKITIGIDLGTSNSCVSIWRNHKLQIISDKHGNTTFPSIIAFNKTGRVSCHSAKSQIERNQKNTIYDVKRLIGKNFSDQVIQNDIPYLTYDLVGTKDDNILINTTFGNSYTPEIITSMILTKLKAIAQDYVSEQLGADYIIDSAIVTIPAYFNDSQRQATLDACKIAQLNCIRLLNEPTAAALAYGINIRTDMKNTNLIVFDLGGGTLDISLLNIDEGVFNVIGTAGNSHLGGEDFNQFLYSHVYSKVKEIVKEKNNGSFDDKYCSKNVKKLQNACENCKIELSSKLSSKIYIEEFYKTNNGYISIDITITREEFELVCKPLFDACMHSVNDILQMTQFTTERIQEIILVGGATRMPKIKFLLSMFFNKEPCSSINPDVVVAAGAAIQGYLMTNKDDPFCSGIVLLDVIPLSLGIPTSD
jgi:L1 cell adhesion molecule like protein